jgi:hypothetical protein
MMGEENGSARPRNNGMAAQVIMRGHSERRLQTVALALISHRVLENKKIERLSKKWLPAVPGRARIQISDSLTAGTNRLSQTPLPASGAWYLAVNK